MQIEEAFRDGKSVSYGLGLSQKSRMNKHRRSVLCLLVTLAIFMLWCIGTAGKQMPIAKQLRVNSSSKRSPYSVVFLARLLIARHEFRISEKTIKTSLTTIPLYMDAVLCE